MTYQEQGEEIYEIIQNAAQRADGVSLVSSDKYTISNPRHLGTNWIYLEPDHNSDLSEFYDLLPYSIKQIICVEPVKEALLVSYYKSQVTDPIEFHKPLNDYANKLLEQCIEHINYLYRTTTLQHHIKTNQEKVVELKDDNKVYVSEEILESFSQKKEHKAHSITNLLATYNIQSIKVEPTPKSDAYDYAITFGWKLGRKHNPNNVISEFIQSVLDIYHFSCANCSEPTVLQSKSAEKTFFCTNCYTQYHASGIDFTSQFFRHTPQQFIANISNKLQGQEQQTYSIDALHSQLQNNATQLKNVDQSEWITINDSPNRTIKYEFRDDSVMTHIFYKHLYVKVALGGTYNRKDKEPTINPRDTLQTASCRLCSRYTDYMETTLMGSTQVISNPVTGRTGILDYTKVCSDCLDQVLGSTEEILSEEVSDEVILLRTI